MTPVIGTISRTDLNITLRLATVFQAASERFEAGTGDIADAVGLGAVIDYPNTKSRLIDFSRS